MRTRQGHTRITDRELIFFRHNAVIFFRVNSYYTVNEGGNTELFVPIGDGGLLYLYTLEGWKKG